jgi:hypothetical protein
MHKMFPGSEGLIKSDHFDLFLKYGLNIKNESKI